MKAKEKAKELVYEMSLATDEYGYINTNVHRHKQCAIIAVNEILDIAYWEYMESMGEKEEKYWKQVKQEIIKL
jgi:hypothetical protein